MKNIDLSQLIPLLGALALWAYHKAKGDKQQDLTSLAEGFARQQVAAIIADPTRLATAREDITQVITAGLIRAGFKPGALMDTAVSIVVEHAIADVAHKLLPTQIDKMAAAAASVVTGIAAAEAAGEAAGRAHPLGTVEIVAR